MSYRRDETRSALDRQKLDWDTADQAMIKGKAAMGTTVKRSTVKAPVPLLELCDVRVRIGRGPSAFAAVDGVNMAVHSDRTLGLVGESGCGKSMLALAIMGLLPPVARVSGKILFRRGDGTRVDLAALPPDGPQMRSLRGREIAMVFQEPMRAFNPVYTIGQQISEAVRLHTGMKKAAAWARAVEALHMVGMASPKERAADYPHQLSGGMRQRAMIALAIASGPRLLICDEPTTALDVTVQAQILDLLRSLKATLQTAVVLITHDLGVVAEAADEVAVMYLGQVVERGSVHRVFTNKSHPYTQGLFRSMPPLEGPRQGRLEPIPGSVDDPRSLHRGCRFYRRCPFTMPQCTKEPPVTERRKGHLVRCWLHASGSSLP